MPEWPWPRATAVGVPSTPRSLPARIHFISRAHWLPFQNTPESDRAHPLRSPVLLQASITSCLVAAAASSLGFKPPPRPHSPFCSNLFRCVSPCSKSATALVILGARAKVLPTWTAFPSPLWPLCPPPSLLQPHWPTCRSPDTATAFPPHSLRPCLSLCRKGPPPPPPPETCMGCSFT